MDEHAQSTVNSPQQPDQLLEQSPGQAPEELPGQLPEQTSDGLSAPRRRLGRGLSSLLGGLAEPAIVEDGRAADAPVGEFTLIDEAVISRNPFQPRKEFAEESLAEMVTSITQHGILQPLL